MGAIAIDQRLLNAKEDLKNKFFEYYKIQLTKKESLEFDLLANKVFYYFDLPNNNENLNNYLKRIYENIHNLSFIKGQLEESRVNEYIFCNEKYVMKDINGKLIYSLMQNISESEFQLALETMAYKDHKEFSFRKPFISFRTFINNQYFRATIIHQSLTNNNRPKLFLRTINERIFSLDEYNLCDSSINIIKSCIQNKSNIIVTGATSSGKTSFLRSLLNQVNDCEHIIIMEDTCELEFQSSNFTHLLSNDSKGKSLKDYCSYALRMRPDRCVLGEIRSEEVIPYILSMNTGHKGMMASLHANGPEDTIQRLATLFSLYSDSSTIKYETIMKLLSNCMEIIIHMEEKKVSSISQVMGIDSGRPIIRTLYDKNESK
jgi:Flp pilus assembly CpaF family ATPase